FVWRIPHYVSAPDHIYSPTFTLNETKWRLVISGKRNIYLSIVPSVKESDTDTWGRRAEVEFLLCDLYNTVRDLSPDPEMTASVVSASMASSPVSDDRLTVSDISDPSLQWIQRKRPVRSTWTFERGSLQHGFRAFFPQPRLHTSYGYGRDPYYNQPAPVQTLEDMDYIHNGGCIVGVDVTLLSDAASEAQDDRDGETESSVTSDRGVEDERERERDSAPGRKASSTIRRRGRHGYIGLFNQGATCYMNSLLQSMHHLSGLRHLVYGCNTVQRKGTEVVAIEGAGMLLELQRLFYRMETAPKSVSTRQLTAAFGWSGAEAFQQHDVGELMHILFEKIEEKLGEDKDRQQAFIDMFRVKTSRYIRCTDIDYVSESESAPQLTLQLPVKGCSTVYDSLRSMLQPSVLDGQNKYEVPGQGKHPAVMGEALTTLPPVMFMTLKRFDLDLRTFQPVKITSRLEYPARLEMSPFIGSDSPVSQYLRAHPTETAKTQTHFKKMFRVSTAHYQAQYRDADWMCFNDTRVDTLSFDDVCDESWGGTGRFAPTAYMLCYVQDSQLALSMPTNRALRRVEAARAKREGETEGERCPVLSRKDSIQGALSVPDALLQYFQSADDLEVQREREKIKAASWVQYRIVTPQCLRDGLRGAGLDCALSVESTAYAHDNMTESLEGFSSAVCAYDNVTCTGTGSDSGVTVGTTSATTGRAPITLYTLGERSRMHHQPTSTLYSSRLGQTAPAACIRPVTRLRWHEWTEPASTFKSRRLFAYIEEREAEGEGVAVAVAGFKHSLGIREESCHNPVRVLIKGYFPEVPERQTEGEGEAEGERDTQIEPESEVAGDSTGFEVVSPELRTHMEVNASRVSGEGEREGHEGLEGEREDEFVTTDDHDESLSPVVPRAGGEKGAEAEAEGEAEADAESDTASETGAGGVSMAVEYRRIRFLDTLSLPPSPAVSHSIGHVRALLMWGLSATCVEEGLSQEETESILTRAKSAAIDLYLECNSTYLTRVLLEERPLTSHIRTGDILCAQFVYDTETQGEREGEGEGEVETPASETLDTLKVTATQGEREGERETVSTRDEADTALSLLANNLMPGKGGMYSPSETALLRSASLPPSVPGAYLMGSARVRLTVSPLEDMYVQTGAMYSTKERHLMLSTDLSALSTPTVSTPLPTLTVSALRSDTVPSVTADLCSQIGATLPGALTVPEDIEIPPYMQRDTSTCMRPDALPDTADPVILYTLSQDTYGMTKYTPISQYRSVQASDMPLDTLDRTEEGVWGKRAPVTLATFLRGSYGSYRLFYRRLTVPPAVYTHTTPVRVVWFGEEPLPIRDITVLVPRKDARLRHLYAGVIERLRQDGLLRKRQREGEGEGEGESVDEYDTQSIRYMVAADTSGRIMRFLTPSMADVTLTEAVRGCLSPFYRAEYGHPALETLPPTEGDTLAAAETAPVTHKPPIHPHLVPVATVSAPVSVSDPVTPGDTPAAESQSTPPTQTETETKGEREAEHNEAEEHRPPTLLADTLPSAETLTPTKAEGDGEVGERKRETPAVSGKRSTSLGEEGEREAEDQAKKAQAGDAPGGEAGTSTAEKTEKADKPKVHHHRRQIILHHGSFPTAMRHRSVSMTQYGSGAILFGHPLIVTVGGTQEAPESCLSIVTRVGQAFDTVRQRQESLRQKAKERREREAEREKASRADSDTHTETSPSVTVDGCSSATSSAVDAVSSAPSLPFAACETEYSDLAVPLEGEIAGEREREREWSLVVVDHRGARVGRPLSKTLRGRDRERERPLPKLHKGDRYVLLHTNPGNWGILPVRGRLSAATRGRRRESALTLNC
ncbi:hypothetical protein KIPB_000315, partial [Kipferlia bialata]